MSIILNKDRELVEEVRKQLRINEEKYGKQYCPCVVPYAYELENNEDYICMCKEFREQESGPCSCGLYIKTKDKIMETIKIKYLSNEIDKITKIDKGDWIDLRSAEKVSLSKGDFKLIPLGVAMQLPKGYEAHIVPRSSTYKNFGVIQTNHQAVIDESYCGDNDQWFLPVYALRDTVININDRICQFRIMKKQPPIKFEEVNILGNEDRGGIGSTGTK